MRVFPKPGLLVRDPVKRDHLPDKGRDVDPSDPYWLRRMTDGDVTTEPPKAEPPARARGGAPDNSSDGNPPA